jgi:hypothetical protein
VQHLDSGLNGRQYPPIRAQRCRKTTANRGEYNFLWLLAESKSGRAGIRTQGARRLAGFQDRSIRPLWHPTEVLFSAGHQTESIQPHILSLIRLAENKQSRSVPPILFSMYSNASGCLGVQGSRGSSVFVGGHLAVNCKLCVAHFHDMSNRNDVHGIGSNSRERGT